MPGVTVWLPAAGETDAGMRFRRAQQLMVRAPAETAVVDVERERCIVGHVGYPAYPIRTWAEPDFSVVFEGQLYGRSEDQLSRDVSELFRRSFNSGDAVPVVSDFVKGTDGDFLAIGVAAAGDRCIAFSDALGRLPTYLHIGRVGVVLARECKFVASVNGGWSFDQLGLAHHLWLGYPLGERTLFDGIERTTDGFFLDARMTGAGIEARRASSYAVRYDNKPDSRGLKAAAADVASRFVTATEARAHVAGAAPTVVSLSGGNDSRSVLGGLSRSGPDPIAATFRRAGQRDTADIRVAERVADSLHIPWIRFDLPPASTEAEDGLVWMKDGHNSVVMAYILPFLEEIVRRWGDGALLLTGDGGDKVFPDLRPVRRPRTMDALVQTVVDDAMSSRAEEVEALLGLEAGSLLEGLRSRLGSYPEESLDHKAVRFLIAERGRKALFEGEDRARSFLWQASPFYALPVFEAAMAVPDEHKSDLRFYAEFQRNLDPALLTIPHADVGMSIDSVRYHARAVARRWTIRAMGPLGRPLLQHMRADGSDTTALRSDTMLKLRDARLVDSKLMEMLEPREASKAVFGATRRGLYNWRTVLLVDQLWRERLPTGSGMDAS